MGSRVGADAKYQILVSLRRFWTLCWEERGPSSLESLVLAFALLPYSWLMLESLVLTFLYAHTPGLCTTNALSHLHTYTAKDKDHPYHFVF